MGAPKKNDLHQKLKPLIRYIFQGPSFLVSSRGKCLGGVSWKKIRRLCHPKGGQWKFDKAESIRFEPWKTQTALRISQSLREGFPLLFNKVVVSKSFGDPANGSHLPCAYFLQMGLVKNHQLVNKWISSDFWTINSTVDGQNPAPPRMIIIPLFIGF